MAKRNDKKAQIVGQIFIFILAGLVFVLIIAYGYKAISYFLDKQQQVTIIDFKTDLELGVSGVKSDFGTVRKVQLTLPSKFLGVCFFDLSNCADNPELDLANQIIKVPWAHDACATQSANVFTVPRTEDILLPDMSVDGYVCVPNTGSITLRMEGTGRKAKVSAWTP